MSSTLAPPLFQRLRPPSLRLPTVSVELVALLASLFFSIASNQVLWHHVLADLPWHEARTWMVATCLFVAVTAFQFGLLALVLTRRTVRPLLSLLLVATAFASYFMQKYTVFLGPAMLRSVLHTDTHEARELLSWDLLPHLAWQAALPLWLLWRVPLAGRPWPKAALRRMGALLAGMAVMVLAGLLAFQDLAALARNHRDYRFLVTPSNYLYSLAKLGRADAASAALPLVPVGRDATLGVAWGQRARPLLFVLVVGETARAANWGLNGYERQTTPELSKLDVLNFPDVTSCGTDTETSLPCMFSSVGRRDYDERRIHGQESLLHVLAHAGFKVQWRDNQSGCKGVCAGLDEQRLDGMTTPALCADGRCLDEILLQGLDRVVDDAHGNRFIVLHQLGSHGPAYASRYPQAFGRFGPACAGGELRHCSQAEIVNAYDNSLLYTDHFLAGTIRFLQAEASRYDTAMLYLSDHGESLGEHNVYLHGLPWSIAPREQKQVPMVMWLSPGYVRDFGMDLACLRRQALKPSSHDQLFHTVLGLLDVRTDAYDGSQDISEPCRRSDNPLLRAAAPAPSPN